MSEVPDKVIEQAQAAADCCDEFGASLRAFADVIATWARNQERERIRKVVGHRYGEAEAAYDITGGTYEQGRMDGVGELLTALDREEDQ